MTTPGFDETAAINVRVPPHNLHAERALIGSWLLSAKARAHHVDPDDFYHPAGALIATAIGELADAGVPVDQLTVADHLDRTGHLAACGGPANLASLIADTPLTGHASRYAEIVRRDAHLRRLLRSATDLADAIYALDDTATDHTHKALVELLEAGSP